MYSESAVGRELTKGGDEVVARDALRKGIEPFNPQCGLPVPQDGHGLHAGSRRNFSLCKTPNEGMSKGWLTAVRFSGFSADR